MPRCSPHVCHTCTCPAHLQEPKEEIRLVGSCSFSIIVEACELGRTGNPYVGLLQWWPQAHNPQQSSWHQCNLSPSRTWSLQPLVWASPCPHNTIQKNKGSIESFRSTQKEEYSNFFLSRVFPGKKRNYVPFFLNYLGNVQPSRDGVIWFIQWVEAACKDVRRVIWLDNCPNLPHPPELIQVVQLCAVEAEFSCPWHIYGGLQHIPSHHPTNPVISKWHWAHVD